MTPPVARSKPSSRSTRLDDLGGQLRFYGRSHRLERPHRCAATRRRSCGCSPRSASAPARSRSSAAPSASSPSWPSSPAPRSACRATRRSTSSAPRRSPASSPPTSTPARSRRWSPAWRWPRRSAAASPRSSARCGSARRSTRSRSWASRALPFLVTTRMIAGFVAVIPLYVHRPAVVVRRDPAHRDRLLRPVEGHLRPLLPPVPAAGRRALVVRQGAGLRGRDHPDPLLLRLHGERRPGRRRRGRRPGGPHRRSSRSTSSTSSSAWPSGAPPRPCGSRGERRADDGARAAARPERAAARVRRRVPRRARAAGRRSRSRSTTRRSSTSCTSRCRPTASATSSPPPADVKLRGLIVGEVRTVSSDGAKAHGRPRAAARARSG